MSLEHELRQTSLSGLLLTNFQTDDVCLCHSLDSESQLLWQGVQKEVRLMNSQGPETAAGSPGQRHCRGCFCSLLLERKCVLGGPRQGGTTSTGLTPRGATRCKFTSCASTQGRHCDEPQPGLSLAVGPSGSLWRITEPEMERDCIG